MPMKIIRDDITKVKADVIVNTANPHPLYADGTDRAIYEAAGAQRLLEERKKIGEIERGEIAVTPAFALEAKYIIHAVGPWWEGGLSGEADVLRSCYRKSLEKAVELNCRSIALPLMASGSNRFPKAEALALALEEINRFLIKNDLEVILVVFDRNSFALSEKVFHDIRTYIDEHYVDDLRRFEYPDKDEETMKEIDRGGSFKTETVSGPSGLPEKKVSKIPGKLTKEKLVSAAVKEETFQECLLRLMRERDLNPPDVYKAAILDRKMFSKIISDRNAKPKKRNVIAIALAMKLELSQALDLISRAGYSLTANNEFDLVIRWCFENHCYDINDINDILHDFGLPILGSNVRD